MDPIPDEAGLASRWARARETALATVIPAKEPQSNTVDNDDEETRAVRALQQDQAQLLHAVFAVSQALGRSWARYHRVNPTLEQLASVLPRLGVACVAGPWVPSAGCWTLTRLPCSQGALGLCAYWREATDGLVSGMSTEARFSRHRSAAAGDPACVDVLFEGVGHPLRHGAIPEHMEDALRSVSSTLRLLDSRARVEWLGLSEGVLHYRLAAVTQSDGPQLALEQMLHTQVSRRIPGVVLQDATSRAVFSG